MNYLNQAASQILEQVSNYRVELGHTFHQLIEVFSFMFVKQFEIFNHVLTTTEQEYSTRYTHLRQQES